MEFSRAILRLAVYGSVFCLLSSCAGVPTVKESTGADSVDISMALKCEMRDGIIDLLGQRIGYYEENKNLAARLSRSELYAYLPPPPYSDDQDDDERERRARHEADAFDAFLRSGYKNIPRNDPGLVEAIETFSKMSVTWIFDFDITQTDTIDSSIDLASIVTRGALSTNLSGTVIGQRQSKNNWAAWDRLDLMLTNTPLIRYCNDLRKVRSQPNDNNIIYPIAGKLGLQKIVGDFFSKNLSGGMIGQKTEAELLVPFDQAPAPPAERYHMLFTTTLKGGVSPTLQIDVLSKTEVKGAMFKIARERRDFHEVQIILGLPSIKVLTVAQARSAKERAEAKEIEKQIQESQKQIIVARKQRRDAERSNVLQVIEQALDE